MYEHLAGMFGGPPNSDHFQLYSCWAQYNWGMIITGNVQVSPKHLSLGRDITLPRCITEKDLQPFKTLAKVIHGEEHFPNDSTRLLKNDSLAIMQLSHAGRQSPRLLGGRSIFARPFAPSVVALGSGESSNGLVSDLFHRLLFQTPQALSLEEIDGVVDAFVQGAKLAHLSGFDGVQLHAAHGCKFHEY